ncbi:MAG: amidohydrolase family protein, partial [Pseudomonadota bacterium]|nr:amidohydrolase family protein [Pseudomonadota bacterium]
MQCITVTNALLPSGWHYHQTLEIENGRIVNIRSATEREKALSVNGRLLPGYVDVQVNGGGGVLFNAKPSAAAIETMALAHLRFGTTSMLPTIITDNADTMARAADAIAEVLAAGPECIKTLIKGIHFEGPFLSTAKKGVHDDRF